MQENNINLTSADERSLQFVARHYRQGAFDADRPGASSTFRVRAATIVVAS